MVVLPQFFLSILDHDPIRKFKEFKAVFFETLKINFT